MGVRLVSRAQTGRYDKCISREAARRAPLPCVRGKMCKTGFAGTDWQIRQMYIAGSGAPRPTTLRSRENVQSPTSASCVLTPGRIDTTT
nr:MAG TPA: hypothetical protein [Inoviridae sp.]